MAASTRRGFLTGMGLGATQLLFSRAIHAAEVFGAAQGVPAVGNKHLLTLVAVNENTLRLRVIQNGKQGPAAEIGIVPRVWPERASKFVWNPQPGQSNFQSARVRCSVLAKERIPSTTAEVWMR